MPVRILRPFYFVILLYSCNPIPRDVRIVLDRAGKNKVELEKVIEHYSKEVGDSLKLKAAYFLIKNMGGHYSYVGKNVELLTNVYRSVNKIPIINEKRPKERKEAYQELVDSLQIDFDFEKQYDIQSITAEYLINNINEAFESWENQPWSNDLNFKIFCEYILPYRIENEQLTSWRKLVRDEFEGMFDKLYYEGGAIYEAEEAYTKSIESIGKPNSASNGKVVRMSAKKENFIEFRDINCGVGGEKIIFLKYYNGGKQAEQDLIINGTRIKRIVFPRTGKWRKPHTLEIPVTLKAKNNIIRLESVKNELSLDFIEITGSENYRLSYHSDIISGGTYRIKNNTNGLYLSFENKNGRKILTVGPKEEEGQSFRLIYCDYGFYSINPLVYKKTNQILKVLSIEENGYEIGVNDYNVGEIKQKWAILALEDNYFKIVNKSNGKCLEVIKTTEGSDRIVQREFDGNDRQRWRFEMVEIEDEVDSIFHISRGGSIEASFRTYDIHKDFVWYLLKGTMPSMNACDLIQTKSGDCREQTQFLTYLSRGFAIPIATDFSPRWRHIWNVIFDKNGKPVRYYFAHRPGQKAVFDEQKRGKVFRKTFSENPESLAKISAENEAIPEFFRNAHMIDVTSEYSEVSDITFDLEYDVPNGVNYAYLAEFNGKEWVPVHWGRIDNGKVNFKAMGRDIIYLPLFFKDEGFYVAGEVFHLTEEGNVNKIFADTSRLKKMILKRKYPMDEDNEVNYRMIGGRFQGANTPDFSDAITFYTFNKKTEQKYYTLQINNKKKFKYLRYIGADSTYSTINEIIFFYNNNELNGKIIGTPGSYMDEGSNINKAFDKDILKYFEAPVASGGWVGLELNKSSKISKIRFMPRTDGNCIEPGDEYELVYWDNEWISLGRMIATKDSLVFDNVPSDGLYLLHNLTKGKQERIFTYEDGQQVWW